MDAPGTRLTHALGLITIHNSSCGKVMFLHLSVILFAGGWLPLGPGGVYLWEVCLPLGPWGVVYTPPGRHPLGRHPLGRHPPQDGHCSRRYASYWNAFLLLATTKLGQGICDSVNGGCLPQCMLGYHPPGADPPGADPPGADTPQTKYTPKD